MLKLSISIIGSFAILLATAAANSDRCTGNTRVTLSGKNLDQTAQGRSTIIIGRNECSGDSTVVERDTGTNITDVGGNSVIQKGDSTTIVTSE